MVNISPNLHTVNTTAGTATQQATSGASPYERVLRAWTWIQ